MERLKVEQSCPFCGQFIAIAVDEGTPERERHVPRTAPTRLE